MHDGPLNDPLKAKCRLGINIIGPLDDWRVVRNELGERFAQIIHVGRAGLEDLGCRGVIEQRKQKMLHRDELVPLLPGLNEGHV